MCTLFFFHHTNSPVYMHFFLSFFSRKVSLSSLFTPSFHTILTLCATATCGGELFFRDVHSKDEKKSFLLTKKKRANIFLSCTSSVFWITDIFSNRHPMQCRRVLGWLGEIDSLSLLLHNVRVLREFFVYFSFFLCTNFFFVF